MYEVPFGFVGIIEQDCKNYKEGVDSEVVEDTHCIYIAPFPVTEKIIAQAE